MKYCLTCRCKNDDNSIKCYNCGGIFFSDIIKGNENALSIPDYLVCSKCKSRVSANQIICQKCGYSVDLTKRDYQLPQKLALGSKLGQITLRNGDILGRTVNGRESLLKEDPYVSECHIRVVQAGLFFTLVDISEGNSFIHNKNMIPPKGKSIVCTGDELIVGVTHFSVEIVKCDSP